MAKRKLPDRGDGLAERVCRLGIFIVALVVLASPLRATELETILDPDAAADDPLLEEWEEPVPVSDPFEGLNRGTLRFNQGLDRWFLTPVTRVYSFLVPALARRAVLRVFRNLNAPAVTINDLLQREWSDAGITVARFVMNSSFGIGGLFDPAKELGLEGHDSDFGQTLALYGMPSGPFLMLPVLGPTTARDGTGYVVDFFFRPTAYLLPFADLIVFTTIHEGSLGLATLEAQSAGLHALEESSIDFYSALRSAYTQKRNAEIWARREHHRAVEVADSSVNDGAPLVDGELSGSSRTLATSR